MTSDIPPKLPDIFNFSPLYVTDRELHALINPRLGWDRFRAVIRQAELHGFPPVQKMWGGRYWPKVKAWLDKDNRVDDHDINSIAEDGPENFDAAPRKDARSQTKRIRPTLLDGASGNAQSARLPRPVYPITSGRR